MRALMPPKVNDLLTKAEILYQLKLNNEAQSYKRLNTLIKGRFPLEDYQANLMFLNRGIGNTHMKALMIIADFANENEGTFTADKDDTDKDNVLSAIEGILDEDISYSAIRNGDAIKFVSLDTPENMNQPSAWPDNLNWDHENQNEQYREEILKACQGEYPESIWGEIDGKPTIMIAGKTEHEKLEEIKNMALVITQKESVINIDGKQVTINHIEANRNLTRDELEKHNIFTFGTKLICKRDLETRAEKHVYSTFNVGDIAYVGHYEQFSYVQTDRMRKKIHMNKEFKMYHYDIAQQGELYIQRYFYVVPTEIKNK